MPDDPRDILKAAGVECAEVDAWCGPWTYSEEVDISAASEKGDAAILALSRLVAKYKWIAEHEGHRIVGEWFIDSRDEEELDFIEAEWNLLSPP